MRLITYYQAELTADTIELYHQCLEDYSLDLISQAAATHVKESKWFPRISELISLMKPHTPQIESVADQQAAVVIDTIRRVGFYGRPNWQDPVTRYLFQGRFNFRSLCSTLIEEETKWFVKEFKEAYLSLSDIVKENPHTLIEAPDEVKQISANLFQSIN